MIIILHITISKEGRREGGREEAGFSLLKLEEEEEEEEEEDPQWGGRGGPFIQISQPIQSLIPPSFP